MNKSIKETSMGFEHKHLPPEVKSAVIAEIIRLGNLGQKREAEDLFMTFFLCPTTKPSHH